MNDSEFNETYERIIHGLDPDVPCHTHWLKYPPPRMEVHYLLGTFLFIIGTAGSIGNFIVLFVFTRFRRMRGPASTFIINLAVSDFCNAILHSMASISSFRGTWSFGRYGCMAYACGVGFFGLVSIVTLAAIAVERYMVITAKPFSGNWKITPYGARKVCAGVWLYCACMSAPPLFGWSSYGAEGFLTSCSWDYLTRDMSNRSYYIYLLTFGFLIPVAIISYCYTFIIAAIYAHGREMDAVKTNSSGYHRGGGALGGQHQSHSRSAVSCSTHKTAEIILKLVLLFLISWSPYSSLSFIGQFINDSWVTPWAASATALMAKASVVYNPIVYGLSHPHFRSSLRAYFSSCAPAASNLAGFHRHNSATMPGTALVHLRSGAGQRSQLSTKKTTDSHHVHHHMHLRCSATCDTRYETKCETRCNSDTQCYGSNPGPSSPTREYVSEPADPEVYKKRSTTVTKFEASSSGSITTSNSQMPQHLTLHHVTLHWKKEDSSDDEDVVDVNLSMVSDVQPKNETISASSCPRFPPPRSVCVVYDGGHVCCHQAESPLNITASLGQLPKTNKYQWDSSRRRNTEL